MTESKSTQVNETRVFYLQKSKGLFPGHLFKEVQDKTKAESKQLKQERKFLEQNDLVQIPFNAGRILVLKQNCSYFDSCVDQIARDVVGQGWEISLKEGAGESKEELERINEFIENSGGESDETLSQTIERAVKDYMSLGWLSIEASRGEGENIDGLWHLPAHQMRVHKDMAKYCQVRGQRKVWFKAYGASGDIDAQTGREGGKDQAHELIFRKRYNPLDDYYGIPPVYSAVRDIMGLIAIEDFNLAFFSNYGVPASMVVVKGSCSEETMRRIINWMDVELKGSDNAHKTMGLSIPPDAEVEVKKMATEVKEGSFDTLEKRYRDKILSRYNMPPYRIGIAEEGSLGGSTAVEQSRIYVHSTIAPVEGLINQIMTHDVIEGGLGCKNYEFKLRRLDIRDLEAEAKIAEKLVSIGARTPNEVIKNMGGEEYPEGDQHYVSSRLAPAGEAGVERREGEMEKTMTALEELQAKLIEAIENKK